MAKEVRLKKEEKIESGYVGFSWTFFIFGFFVPLFRKDFKAALIVIFISIGLGVVTAGAGVCIVDIILAFWYNKYYTENLLKRGFVPVTPKDKILLEKYKVYATK